MEIKEIKEMKAKKIIIYRCVDCNHYVHRKYDGSHWCYHDRIREIENPEIIDYMCILGDK